MTDTKAIKPLLVDYSLRGLLMLGGVSADADDWRLYRRFGVPPGQPLKYSFLSGFDVYWVRVVCSRDIRATTAFSYE